MRKNVNFIGSQYSKRQKETGINCWWYHKHLINISPGTNAIIRAYSSDDHLLSSKTVLIKRAVAGRVHYFNLIAWWKSMLLCLVGLHTDPLATQCDSHRANRAWLLIISHSVSLFLTSHPHAHSQSCLERDSKSLISQRGRESQWVTLGRWHPNVGCITVLIHNTIQTSTSAQTHTRIRTYTVLLATHCKQIHKKMLGWTSPM